MGKLKITVAEANTHVLAAINTVEKQLTESDYEVLLERLKYQIEFKMDRHKRLSQPQNLIKCTCRCHSDKNYKHVAPCCEGGFINIGAILERGKDNG